MKYERYSLRSNPFLEESNDFEQIDRTDLRRDLRRDLLDAVQAGSGRLLVLLGDYGTGKTFTIQKVVGEIRAGTFFPEGTSPVLAAYFKVTPPKTPSGYTKYVVSSVVQEIGRAYFHGEMVKLREDLGEIQAQSTLKTLDTNLRAALSRFGGPREQLAWDYLCGRKLSRTELAELEVASGVDDDSAAEKLFFEVLRFLHIRGVACVVLFVDEIEYIIAGSKAGQVLTTFKEIYDRANELKIAGASLAAPVCVFASTPSAWGELVPVAGAHDAPSPAPTAFWERAEAPLVLPPFSREHTRRLIEDRLSKRRTPGSAAVPLFPFTDATVGMIHRLSQGIPRRILRICGYALREALEQEAGDVDDAIVQRAYENYPWAREPGVATAG